MFSNLFPPVDTGSAQVTYCLARALVAGGHRVVVVTARFSDAPAEEVLDGIQVIRLRTVQLPRLAIAHNFKWFGLTLTLGNLRTLRRLFAQERFDVVHAHNHMFDSALLAVLMSRRFKIPLVLTLHIIVQHANAVYDLILKTLDRTLARVLVVGMADAVVSVDEQMRKYIAARFGRRDTHMIPYGIAIGSSRPGARAEIRARHQLGTAKVILSLGHVTALRDRHELIDAMPAILARHPNAHLLIVGDVGIDGPVKQVSALGLQQNVTFTGAVPHDAVWDYLAAADIEVHWMLGVAALSIAGMEAMAAGVAVMTAEFPEGDAPAGLNNWEHCVTVPQQDVPELTRALMRLLDDDELRTRIAAAGRRFMLEQRSWDNIAEQTEQLYRLVGAGGRS